MNDYPAIARSESAGLGLNDHIYNRLLRERIIWLGSEVRDEIYDTMQYIKPDVATIAMGMAASMGQFLLSSGAKGKRYATPHARVMMHQPSGGIGGTATDVRINAQLILHMKTVLAELTAAQTGKTVEQINSDADRDRWFTAPEALEYGFIDHVVEAASSVTGRGGTA